ncbi:MAG: FAD binding domain-containing protein, partial [Candidatus Aminicenantales bacterium]
KEKIPGARFIAGGTDLMVHIRRQEVKCPALISLRSLPGLSSIEVKSGARIGACATITDIIEHGALGKAYPLLAEAALRLGSIQIRNAATIGGNICNCSPAADMALPLLVYEAEVVLRRAEGERKISLTEFFREPGQSLLAGDEILTEIILSPPPGRVKTIFLKKGRVHMDLALASAALLLIVEGEVCKKARIAAGSVAPVPLRLRKVEELLEGAVVDENLILEARRTAEESISPITDVRASADYRRQIFGVLIERGLKHLLARSKR